MKVIANLIEALIIATWLSVISYLIYTITIGIISRLIRINNADQIGFEIFFELVAAFLFMIVFYGSAYSLFPIYKVVKSNFRLYQSSIILAGIGLGLIYTTITIIDGYNTDLVWLLTLLQIANMGFLWIRALPLIKESRLLLIISVSLTLLPIMASLITTVASPHNARFMLTLVDLSLIIISPYMVWIIAYKRGQFA